MSDGELVLFADSVKCDGSAYGDRGGLEEAFVPGESTAEAAEVGVPPGCILLAGLRPGGGIFDDLFDSLWNKDRKGEAVIGHAGGARGPEGVNGVCKTGPIALGK